MSNYVKVAEKAGDRYLAAMAEGQENVLRGIAAWSQWAPRPAPPADYFALREMTTAAFSFFEKLLEQQHAFAARLLDLTPGRVIKPAAPKAKSSPSTGSASASQPRPVKSSKSRPAKATRSRATSRATKT